MCPSFTVVSLCRVFVHTTSITTTGYRHITKSEERTEQCKTKSKHTGARGASSQPNRLELITYMYLWSNLPSEPMSKMLYAMRKILVIYLVGPCVAMPCPAVTHDTMSGIRRPLSLPPDHDDSTRHLPSRILPANTDSSEG